MGRRKKEEVINSYPEIITDEAELESICSDCKDVKIKDPKHYREIVKKIKNVMRKYNLEALSAPEIGIKEKIFCIDYKDVEIKTYINPLINQSENLRFSRETIPCMPEKEFIVARASNINLYYYSPDGKINSKRLLGKAAYLAQQKIQLFGNLTPVDCGFEIDEEWDKATDEERAEVLSAYLDSMDMKLSEIEKELENDAEFKQADDAVKFMTSVMSGETKLEPIQKEEENK